MKKFIALLAVTATLAASCESSAQAQPLRSAVGPHFGTSAATPSGGGPSVGPHFGSGGPLASSSAHPAVGPHFGAPASGPSGSGPSVGPHFGNGGPLASSGGRPAVGPHFGGHGPSVGGLVAAAAVTAAIVTGVAVIAAQNQ